ncbi:hypothetical protein THAOC_22917, partial [Thalassiosira oceanica]
MGRARPRGPPPSPQTTRRPAPIRAGAPARTVTFRRRPAAVWPGRTAGRRSTPAPSVLTTARRQRARQTLSLEFRWPRNLFVRGEKRDEGRGQPWAVTSPESPVAIGSRGVVKARRREEDLRSADLQTCPLFNFLANHGVYSSGLAPSSVREPREKSLLDRMPRSPAPGGPIVGAAASILDEPGSDTRSSQRIVAQTLRDRKSAGGAGQHVYWSGILREEQQHVSRRGNTPADACRSTVGAKHRPRGERLGLGRPYERDRSAGERLFHPAD